MKAILAIWGLLLAPAAFTLELNVTDYGAVGDRETDNTEAFQKALGAAGAAGGGIVHVPTGHFRIEGNLVIPGGVTLQGTFRVPPSNRHGGSPHLQGSVLLAYAGRGSREGKPFVRLGGSSSTLAGVIITYPEWKKEDVPPVPYPPTVFGAHDDNMAVLDTCIINPYEAIHFNSAGRFLVRNVYGYPSFRGLFTDWCLDVARVENVHFWPFGVHYRADDPYCAWINENGVAFEFARTDWQSVLNTFCFGYGVGYKFSNVGNGGCNGSFVGIGADSCVTPVLVEQIQPYGLLITNGQFVGAWGRTDSVGVHIMPGVTGKVSLNNCSFWGPLDRCVWQQGEQSELSIIGSHFMNWDMRTQGLAAVESEGGRLIVQGNTFMEGKTCVTVGEKVRSAILLGNQCPSGFSVENYAGKRTQMGFNEEIPVEWTEEARLHYHIDVGEHGDSPYLKRWHNQERNQDWGVPDKSMRWSGPISEINAPIVPGKTYTIRMDVTAPVSSEGEMCGLYLGETEIIRFPIAENAILEGKLPPQEENTVKLTLRCRGWIPFEQDPSNPDPRTLGVAVRSIRFRAEGADETRFLDANTGDWNLEE